jgi:tRNA 5-methylaminomethyl-2-thiouridine biosynthesis bifunctional protein
MKEQMAPVEPANIEFEQGTPISTDYADAYFMPGQGLAESRVVFIQANQLAERFKALDDGQYLVIGETGFGTGLNCLLAAQCFADHAPPGARLHLVSAELHPLQPDDLARALDHWPELATWGRALRRAWPAPTPGYHRIRLADNIELTLMFGDATEQWAHSRIEVDSWFLDGFAPARNPAMWSESLFLALATHSRPGCTVATFTAAGQVRRGLEQVGFGVQRIEGFGRKRHRLIAHWPGNNRPRRVRRGRVLIAGAGLAGTTTARAFAEHGWQVRITDPAGIANGASGNRLGVIHTTPSAHLTPQNRFYQLGLCHAMRWFDRLGFPRCDQDGKLDGVLHFPPDERAQVKFARAMESGAWPVALLRRHDEGGFLTPGGFIAPRAWCDFLLDHPGIAVTDQAMEHFRPGAEIRIRLDDGSQPEVDFLVICTAHAATTLPGLGWLPLKTSRGQVSHCRATPESRSWQQAICHAGYLTPAVGGLHSFGATFDHDSDRTTALPDDDRINLAQLEQNLPAHYRALGGQNIDVVDQRAGLRCHSRDTLPLVGALPDPCHNPHLIEPCVGLNLAHGSRAITQAPLCADLLADLASGGPLAADPGLVDALAPERFILRIRRRDPEWMP